MNYKSFDEVLRHFLDRRDEEYRKLKDPDWWWASELGMCRRKQSLRRTGIPKTEEKEWRIRFVMQDGTALHNWREEAAGKMGILVAKELRLVDEKLRYKGRLDLIIKLGDKLSLIDIKTQRPEAFFRRSKKPESERVETYQKLQLASYTYFAKKDYPTLKESRIYFVDRGGGVREEFIFNFGKVWFDKVLSELNILNSHWDKGIFPEKTEKKWQCRYCDYKSICKEVEKNKLTINNVKQLWLPKKKKEK